MLRHEFDKTVARVIVWLFPIISMSIASGHPYEKSGLIKVLPYTVRPIKQKVKWIEWKFGHFIYSDIKDDKEPLLVVELISLTWLPTQHTYFEWKVKSEICWGFALNQAFGKCTTISRTAAALPNYVRGNERQYSGKRWQLVLPFWNFFSLPQSRSE